MIRIKIILISILLIFIVIIVGPKEWNSTLETSIEKSEDELSKEKVILDYLIENYSEINIDDESQFLDLAILDEDIMDKEIFFTGEVHGIKANSDLNMKFLKYFKDKTDFKYYLAEYSYSNAHFLNKFLETGDTKILKEIFKELKGSYSWNKDSYKFWIDLYEYNNSLPENSRIQLIGVDIELQPITGYRYLVDVLPNEDPPEEIKKMIDNTLNTFNKLDGTGFGSIYGTAKDLKKDIDSKEKIYREYLGENYFGFKMVTINLLNYETAFKNKRNQVDWNNIRDKMIYENFELIERRLPKGKYFGQWGVNHGFQSKEKDIKWFAALLNDNKSKFKDKILSIAFNYDNCKQMGKLGDQQYIINQLDFTFPYMKVSNDAIGGDLNIYKLNGKNSPFNNIPMYYTFTQKLLEDSILEFIQYIVYIVDSGPTEPLYNEY